MSRWLVFIYGLVAYLIFLGVFLYAIGFLGNVVVPKSIDSGEPGPLSTALVINGLLLGVFALQHSVMARPAFKDWLTGYIPRAAERSTYVMASNLALVLLFFLLRDGHSMLRWAVSGLSDGNRECARTAAAAGWKTLQGYVRGSAIVAGVDAAGIGIGLVVLGVPLALPLTLITFVASFVPLVGATVAGALAVLVALAAKGPVTALLVLGVVGFALMFAGVLLAISPGKRGAAAPAPEEPTAGASKAKRSGGGFMDRLNDRWDRRQEGRD